MSTKLMQIGAIAKKANVNIQTIRYYERRKILKPKIIKDSGYRLYDSDAIKTIQFVKNAQELGFSLNDICELLNMRNSTPSRCQKVRIKAKDKLKDVKEKISLLKTIEKTLTKLVRDCEFNKLSSECPIISSMETQ